MHVLFYNLASRRILLYFIFFFIYFPSYISTSFMHFLWEPSCCLGNIVNPNGFRFGRFPIYHDSDLPPSAGAQNLKVLSLRSENEGHHTDRRPQVYPVGARGFVGPPMVPCLPHRRRPRLSLPVRPHRVMPPCRVTMPGRREPSMTDEIVLIIRILAGVVLAGTAAFWWHTRSARAALLDGPSAPMLDEETTTGEA